MLTWLAKSLSVVALFANPQAGETERVAPAWGARLNPMSLGR